MKRKAIAAISMALGGLFFLLGSYAVLHYVVQGPTVIQGHPDAPVWVNYFIPGSLAVVGGIFYLRARQLFFVSSRKK